MFDTFSSLIAKVALGKSENTFLMENVSKAEKAFQSGCQKKCEKVSMMNVNFGSIIVLKHFMIMQEAFHT